MKQLVGFKWINWFKKCNVHQPIYCVLHGSHLFGFPSKDSDYDIRGCHIEPIRDVIGISGYHEIRKRTEGNMDFVSFDLKKECGLILANNPNVLENYFTAPVYKSKVYPELKGLAEKSISKLIAKPYWGLAQHNLHKYLRTFNESFREAPVKKFLYVIRALMAGIYALDTGRIQPNIVKLNKMRKFQIDVVNELIKLKKAGKVKEFQNGNPNAEEAIRKLEKMFHESEEGSTLPAAPNTYSLLNEFLIKWRQK